MRNKEKTVFFGPFFGEMGWEYAFWHGWVKKMCRENYAGYRKIISSYPGRMPFYPDADEFWPHPKEITNLKISQRAYISDCWFGDFPKANNPKNIDRNIGQHAKNLFDEYKNKLPDDTIFYVPHKLNTYRLNGQPYLMGTLFLRGLSFYQRPKTLSVPLEHQEFQQLKATPQAEEFLNKILDIKQRLIALFPRYRASRRPDKSWSKENYDLLITYLQKEYPAYAIGIFGAPGGCYYVDGVPKGCIDFINLPENLRFDIQVAALNRSIIAVGSESGGIHNALLCGCPTIEWGWPINRGAVCKLNFLGTRLVFWPELNPSVEKIQEIFDLMMEKKEEQISYPIISKDNYKKYEKEDRSFSGQANFGKIALREIVSRIYLKYLNAKKLKEGVINNNLILID